MHPSVGDSKGQTPVSSNLLEHVLIDRCLGSKF